jgi:hypothetical protein
LGKKDKDKKIKSMSSLVIFEVKKDFRQNAYNHNNKHL